MPSLGDLGPWGWLVLGLVLIGLETVAPGIFLVWLGIAAILTGLADVAFDLPWQGQLVLFAALSVLAVAGGRLATRRRGDRSDELPFLNRRGEALVGRSFVLEEALVAGHGRIRVDDTVWRIAGPDLPAGAQVTVRGLDGTVLRVEAAARP